MRSAIRYGLFPTHFAAALTIAWYGCNQGWHPGLLMGSISVSTAMILIVVERISPYHRSWNESRSDVGTDAIHLVVSSLLLPQLIQIAIHAALLSLAAYLASPHWTGVWPGALPLPLQLVCALILTQFFEYWWHRFSHQVPALWRLHATHHSPGRLYWLNASRFHPLDTAGSVTLSMGLLLLLGAGSELLVMFSVWVAVHGLYQHCNVDLRLGPLNYIFSMAELHRWHHSLSLEEANHNFGNNIIFWDIVFGTMFWPRDRDPPAEIGIGDMPHFPSGYLGQLLSPLRWKKLHRDAK